MYLGFPWRFRHPTWLKDIASRCLCHRGLWCDLLRMVYRLFRVVQTSGIKANAYERTLPAQFSWERTYLISLINVVVSVVFAACFITSDLWSLKLYRQCLTSFRCFVSFSVCLFVCENTPCLGIQDVVNCMRLGLGCKWKESLFLV